MPDGATVADLRLVESHLRALRSVDQLRRLLADLDYQVGDEPVSTGGWKPELATGAKDGNLRVVARHDDFVITHCRLPELRITPEREMVTRLVRQYDRGLFAFSDLGEFRWHLVNVKRDSRRHNRLVLRRIAVGPEEQLRTAIERTALLMVEDPSWTGLEVELRHEEAFDVERVTEQFYRDYKDIFDHIVGRLQRQVNLRTARAFAQQFMNRMMFLYFLQKKGWMDGRRDFVPWLWQKYQEEPPAQGNFYARYLDPLFFSGLTSPSDELTPSVTKQQLYARQDIPDEVKQVFLRLPFLNGGLFSKIEGVDDQGLDVLDSEFENLFENLLEHYNFTVSEDTPLDVEVAVNPEMLGKVYENLVLEEERGQAGIFYTPRVELDFMCRRSLIQYLGEESIVDRPDLIRLVMNADTPEFIPDFPPERLREIRRKLEEVTVVDPACGSGAFLVGMMQVLSGLHRLICERLGEPYRDFQVKKQIIGENLFGVDIKDWAVRVAELRLWLSLIIHASIDEVQEEPGKAILPNLTFRIQTGDSLVEEIAGRSLSLRARYGQMSQDVRGKVNRLVDRKMDYYYNRGEVMPDQEVRRLETEVFRAILGDELAQIDRELRRLRAEEQAGFQQELDIARAGGPVGVGAAQVSPEKARLRREIERIEQERAQIIDVRNSQDIERGKGPFLWDIEFAEVFQRKGGFDIVIGNPPYVRQEEIAPLGKDPQNFSADQWLEEKRRYKGALQRSVQTYWGPEVRVGGRADYYVYFYLLGLALLRERGSFCFITSNSWLDVGYGADLQRFLLTHIEVKDIYDNHAKRSFASSDINTVIVLLQRPMAGADLSTHTIRFVAFKRPFEEVLTAENLTLIEWADSTQSTEELRVYPLAHLDLWRAGLGSGTDVKKTMDLGFGLGLYTGNKWGGKYLRAPDIFVTLDALAQTRFLPLRRLAQGERYLNTGGADGFFIFTKFRKVQRGQFYEVTNTSKEGVLDGSPTFLIEADFLRPALKSTETASLWVKEPDALVLDIPPETSVSETLAREYIEWGEDRGFNRRSVTRLQSPWWKAPRQARQSGPVLWMRNHRKVHKAFYNPERLIAVRFYRYYPEPNVDALLLAAVLNSSYVALAKEIYGSTKILGVLDTTMEDMDMICIPYPERAVQAERLSEAFKNLCRRAPLPFSEEIEQADRKELDSAVFDILGATPADLQRAHEAILKLIANRYEKEGKAEAWVGEEEVP